MPSSNKGTEFIYFVVQYFDAVLELGLHAALLALCVGSLQRQGSLGQPSAHEGASLPPW